MISTYCINLELRLIFENGYKILRIGSQGLIFKI